MILKRGLVLMALIAMIPVLDAVLVLRSDDLVGGRFNLTFVASSFGCTGDNLSPHLAWSGAPAGTRSYALRMFDMDAPTGSGFYHWMVYNIDPSVDRLPRGAGSTNPPAMGATVGNTDWLGTGAARPGGYGGPCPPVNHGPHRYLLTLYALNVSDIFAAASIPTSATGGLGSFALNFGLGPAVLERASLTATYERGVASSAAAVAVSTATAAVCVLLAVMLM